MGTMDVLHWLSQNHELATKGITPAIIPTVLLPLTAVTVGITSLAGIIAGWFGIKLHTEGPKQLLEVLLRKRVLLSMLVMNLLFMGLVRSYVYVKNLPSFIYTIERHSKSEAKASNDQYIESHTRPHDFIGKINPVNFKSLSLEKEIKLEKGAFRSAALSGNSLFYGTDDGNIYEINKNDLSIKRKFFIGTQVTTRPIIYKDRIFAGEGAHDTHHARVYSFDLKNGEFINAFATKGHTEGQPLIGSFNGQDLLFITSGVDGLYAVDPISMKEVWHQIDGHLDATVTVDGGVVFAGSGIEKGSERDRSYATAYEFATGKKIWKQELPLSNWMHPIVTKTDVCYVLGEIYFKSNIGEFYCLNKQNGTPHFSIPIEAPIASKPFYINNGVEEYAFFGDLKDEMCGVNITKKEKMWCHKAGSEKATHAFSSFDFDPKHGVLWYPSFDNGIYAVEAMSGNILSQWKPSKNESNWGKNYGAVNIDGDTLYHMDIEGNLRKFKIN